MKTICVIPARMGSSRFPGKPLEKALGIPLIVHVAKRCLLNPALSKVVVATCDAVIQETCTAFDIESVMTSPTHERCTDRVSEAIEKLDLNLTDQDFVLMVQGDEILVTPDMVQQMIDIYQQNPVPAVNLLSTIYRAEDHVDPNVVKVVANPEGYALYMSREPIPSRYRQKEAPAYQQMGVIGFQPSFLQKFSQLKQTPLEIIESIDMLRILENRLDLRVVYTAAETIAVDVPSDLTRAAQVLEQDEWMKHYA